LNESLGLELFAFDPDFNERFWIVARVLLEAVKAFLNQSSTPGAQSNLRMLEIFFGEVRALETTLNRKPPT
jgi:hypothetical protein